VSVRKDQNLADDFSIISPIFYLLQSTNPTQPVRWISASTGKTVSQLGKFFRQPGIL